MRGCFADSFYFLALLNSRDQAHKFALDYARIAEHPIITTYWVLIEVADALAGCNLRSAYYPLIKEIRNNPDVILLPLSDVHFFKGSELYASRLDKSWSLTDCISFIVMEQMGIAEALTGDHHFEQAGFRALLKADQP